jgi:hypothetical protein
MTVNILLIFALILNETLFFFYSRRIRNSFFFVLNGVDGSDYQSCTVDTHFSYDICKHWFCMMDFLAVSCNEV